MRRAVLFLIFLFAVSLANARINVSNNYFEVFPNETFELNVSFSAFGEDVYLNVSHDSLVSLITPIDSIYFGNGSISGMLNYKFKALKSGNSLLTFSISSSNKTEIANVSVYVKPKYVNFSTDDVLYVNEGEAFDLSILFDVMNVNNVSVSVSYNDLFESNASNIYVGSGSFSKLVVFPFKVSNNVSKGDSKIHLNVCSELGCKEKEVTVYIRALDLDILSANTSIGIGDSVNLILKSKVFNEDANLQVFYDKNWFEIKGLKNVSNGLSTQNITIKMKKHDSGCPNPVFIFRLGDVEKQIRFKIKPYFELNLLANDVVSSNDNLTVYYSVRAFGYNKPYLALLFPNAFSSNFSEEKAQIKANKFVLKPIVSDSKAVFMKIDNCQAQGIVNLITGSTQDIYNISLVGINGSNVENITTAKVTVVKHAGKSAVKLGSPNVCPKGFSFDSSKQTCFSNMPSIVCPPGSIYNPQTKRCEIHPDVVVVCDKGEYNPQTDKCEYKPEVEIVCENGDVLKDNIKLLKSNVKLKNLNIGDKFGDFVVYDYDKQGGRYLSVSFYLKYDLNAARVSVSLYKGRKLIDKEEALLVNLPINNVDRNKKSTNLKIVSINNNTLNFSISNNNALSRKYMIVVSFDNYSCIWHPPEKPVCEKGVYNADTGVCEYEPNVTVNCALGVYNEALDVCIYTPETEVICDKGEYNPQTDKCEYYPETEFICSEGVYNNETGYCEVYPNTTHVCEVGEYNKSSGYCEVYPQETYVCDEGEYNETTGYCEVYPNTSYVCEEGYYDSEKEACIIKVTKEIEDVKHVCEKGTYDEEENACVFYPDSKAICKIGEFNSSLGLCVFEAQTKIVCKKGFYDESTNTCVYEPQESNLTVNISTRVNELTALSMDIINLNNYSVSKLAVELYTDADYELVSYKIGSTSLNPGESTTATYFVKFKKEGDYSLRLKLVDDKGNVAYKRFNVHVEPVSVITGLMILREDKAVSLTALAVMALAALIGTFLNRKRINPHP
ncbi:MAG: hypothetical protein J7K22_04765 [Nanoarchaeota archaeon]|nr:hypothetical protein [Nanoarchaeota archaeon]